MSVTIMIEHYESVAAASGRMLEAARRGDWEDLVSAEAECAVVIERLRHLSSTQALDPEHAQRKRAIIHEVLAHDAEIRDLTQPWMKKLSALLGDNRRERRMRDAYGE